MDIKFQNYAAAIFCGGRSRRMGFDKALILTDRQGQPLLSSLAQNLSRLFGRLYLVSDRADKFDCRDDLAGFTVLADSQPGAGPLGALLTALEAAGDRPLFVTACDMPDLNLALLAQLAQSLEESGADLAAARCGGRVEPLCAFYRPSCRPVFQKALAEGRLALRDSFASLAAVYVDLPAEAAPVNLNRPEQVRRQGLGFGGAETVSALRYEDGRLSPRQELVVAERMLRIEVNGRLWLSLMATPSHLLDLSLGLLFGEGLIASAEDAAEICLEDSLIKVKLRDESLIPPQGRAVRLSGFGAAVASETALSPPQASGSSQAGPRLKAEDIGGLMDRFNKLSGLFRATGGVHGVCFVDPAQPGAEIFREDVGRHNALDKVIGRLLSLGLKASEGLILTTGRVSVEMLLKTWRSGVRFLVSRSAPTDRGVELARSLDMTLIGFARGDSFNVYAGQERLAEAFEGQELLNGAPGAADTA